MLNKLLSFIRQYDLISPGDTVICAVSGGADSVALLFSLYLLKEKLGIRLEAAHFNHGLRGEESDRDEAFVRSLCDRYDIHLHVGSACVTAGEKGLEAAARDARYSFFSTLSGKIATAHTADDNAETVLMHMVRGTGLKGLGGISPMRSNIIRPMLLITRQEVLAFLDAYCLQYVTDSSNETDTFLRNRLRHHVMPLLKQENPRLAENFSAMALRLRADADELEKNAPPAQPEVETLRQMTGAERSRALMDFLKRSGVREPEASHVALVEKLVFSHKPSASADLPGGVRIAREYGRLVAVDKVSPLSEQVLTCPGQVDIPQLGLRIFCEPAGESVLTTDAFTVSPVGPIILRARKPGDTLRLKGGTRQLKKLLIDKKIPAAKRNLIPVLCDDQGVLGVYGIGANLDRVGTDVFIRFELAEREKTEATK